MSHVGGVGDNYSNIKLAVINLNSASFIVFRLTFSLGTDFATEDHNENQEQHIEPQDEDSGNWPVGKQIPAFFGNPILLPQT